MVEKIQYCSVIRVSPLQPDNCVPSQMFYNCTPDVSEGVKSVSDLIIISTELHYLQSNKKRDNVSPVFCFFFFPFYGFLFFRSFFCHFHTFITVEYNIVKKKKSKIRSLVISSAKLRVDSMSLARQQDS